MNPSDAQGEPVARPQFNEALTDLVCALVECVDAATDYIRMMTVVVAVDDAEVSQ